MISRKSWHDLEFYGKENYNFKQSEDMAVLLE